MKQTQIKKSATAILNVRCSSLYGQALKPKQPNQPTLKQKMENTTSSIVELRKICSPGIDWFTLRYRIIWTPDGVGVLRLKPVCSLAAACCWLRATRLTMSSILFQRMYTGHLPRWSPTLPHATLSIGPAPFMDGAWRNPLLHFSRSTASITALHHASEPNYEQRNWWLEQVTPLALLTDLLLPPVIGLLPLPYSSFVVSSASIAASWLRATNELLRKIFSDERADLRAEHLW